MNTTWEKTNAVYPGMETNNGSGRLLAFGLIHVGQAPSAHAPRFTRCELYSSDTDV